jgi:hypothetical protein
MIPPLKCAQCGRELNTQPRAPWPKEYICVGCRASNYKYIKEMEVRGDYDPPEKFPWPTVTVATKS